MLKLNLPEKNLITAQPYELMSMYIKINYMVANHFKPFYLPRFISTINVRIFF